MAQWSVPPQGLSPPPRERGSSGPKRLWLAKQCLLAASSPHRALIKPRAQVWGGWIPWLKKKASAWLPASCSGPILFLRMSRLGAAARGKSWCSSRPTSRAAASVCASLYAKCEKVRSVYSAYLFFNRSFELDMFCPS